jgi:hypothetical protein
MKNFTTAETKSKILHALKDCSLAQKDIASNFNVLDSTVSKLKRKKAEILDENEELKGNPCRKTLKLPVYSDIDLTVYNWFQYAFEKGIPISGELIKTNAMKVAAKTGHINFRASNGWLEKWKKRHQIVFKNIKGEQRSAILAAFKSLEKLNLENFYLITSLKTYSMQTKLVYIFVFFLTKLCVKKMLLLLDLNQEKIGLLYYYAQI